jgi:hypothetical protein
MNNESENRRKKFLRRFAALSSAAIIAGAGAGAGAGCGEEEVEYGPPPVEPTTQTQPDEPTVEYGPPPVDNTGY